MITMIMFVFTFLFCNFLVVTDIFVVAFLLLYVNEGLCSGSWICRGKSLGSGSWQAHDSR